MRFKVGTGRLKIKGVVEKSWLPKPNQTKRYELENTWEDGS
jgi:hypothetical protein